MCENIISKHFTTFTTIVNIKGKSYPWINIYLPRHYWVTVEVFREVTYRQTLCRLLFTQMKVLIFIFLCYLVQVTVQVHRWIKYYLSPLLSRDTTSFLRWSWVKSILFVSYSHSKESTVVKIFNWHMEES